MLELKGRTAVISGAGSGIGFALAHHALALGMSVHAWDIDKALLDKLDPAITATQLDICESAAVRAAADEIWRRSGNVAAIFANAGILRVGRSWEIPLSDWKRLIDVNIGGPVNMMSAFVPGMMQQENRSHIVLTGSQSAFVARPGNAAYSCSKHAIWGLAEALKLELDDAGGHVGVSLLAPGPVRTALAGSADSASNMHDALQRIGIPPDEVAELVFSAIQDNQFWIFTHTDFKADLQARIARVIGEKTPV